MLNFNRDRESGEFKIPQSHIYTSIIVKTAQNYFSSGPFIIKILIIVYIVLNMKIAAWVLWLPFPFIIFEKVKKSFKLSEGDGGFIRDAWLKPKLICDACNLLKNERDPAWSVICLLKCTWPVIFFSFSENLKIYLKSCIQEERFEFLPLIYMTRDFFFNSCVKRDQETTPLWIFCYAPINIG